MRKFANNWTYRTPLRTVEFPAGHETVDADVIAAAQTAGVLVEETDNGDGNENRPAKGSAKGRLNYVKG